MTKHLFISIILLLTLSGLSAQKNVDITLTNTTLSATDSILPLWLRANQHGKVPHQQSFVNLTDVYLGKPHNMNPESRFSWSWGANGIAALGETTTWQLNQAFAALAFKGWELKGGMFHDPLRHAGLSTTNGNLARSGNARPWPMIRLSTIGFKPLPFAGKWLSFRGEYDEGFLNDSRYVDSPQIHHKLLYFKVTPGSGWDIRMGAEHVVMWGGTSPDERIGAMPETLKAYWYYIRGSAGDETFPQTDQNNVAGNQLGTYQLEVKKQWEKSALTFYLSHPFEDFSGVNWRNWPDNLLGIHLNLRKGNPIITDILYEYTHTMQQSIRDSFYMWNEDQERWIRQENDNYYNHGVYRSGFTYHQKTISSPLFFPVQLNDKGIPTSGKALASTRFRAHHLGIKGLLTPHLHWKGLITYIHHYGNYGAPFDPSRTQTSGLLEFDYINPEFPIEIGLSAAFDSGNTITANTGLRLSVTKRW